MAWRECDDEPSITANDLGITPQTPVLAPPVSQGSQCIRPALPPVQDAQHFDQLAPDAIGHDVRRPVDDEFPRSRPPTGT
jgi:hypothetical protein